MPVAAPACTLSRRLFDAVTGCSPLGSTGLPRERRQGMRVPFQQRTLLIPLRDGKPAAPTHVRCRDLSPTGIGLLSPTSMGIGTQFIAILPLRKGSSHVRLLCHVVRCHRLEASLHAIGAVFIEILPGSAELD